MMSLDEVEEKKEDEKKKDDEKEGERENEQNISTNDDSINESNTKEEEDQEEEETKNGSPSTSPRLQDHTSRILSWCSSRGLGHVTASAKDGCGVEAAVEAIAALG